MSKRLQMVRRFLIESGKDVPHPDGIRYDAPMDWLDQELDELVDAHYSATRTTGSERDKYIIEIIDALVDLEYILYNLWLYWGLDKMHTAMFEEVHRSNMTKTKDNRTALDGKILKGESYEPPNLRKIYLEYKRAQKIMEGRK